MSLFTLYTRLRGRIRYGRTLFFSRRRMRMANRAPVISFTFDDFPRSALYMGGEILREHGLAATYYAALGLMNTEAPVGRIFSEEDLHEVVVRGHELGCHTFDHCHSWNTRPGTFEESIARNRQALDHLLPGTILPSLSYPLDIPAPATKKRMEKHFLCCRGGSQTFNSGTADLNFLRAFFLEQSHGDLAAVKSIIDRNSQFGGWLIFATHDIAENPSRFGCTPGFFRDTVRYAVDSGAAILPVAAALKSVRGPHRSPLPAHALARRQN